MVSSAKWVHIIAEKLHEIIIKHRNAKNQSFPIFQEYINLTFKVAQTLISSSF